MHREYGCENFGCLYSDFANCDNGNIEQFGEECPHNEDECEIFNCCELCNNANTCSKYNN